MKITVEQLCVEIATALEVDPSRIVPDTTSSDVEEWDSLGHISILTRLDAVLNDVTERVPDLATATSVPELMALLSSDDS
jgi:hypothetical protein